MALLTMRCETVAVGCHRLRIGLFERFSGVSHLPPVATVAPAGFHKYSMPSQWITDGQTARSESAIGLATIEEPGRVDRRRRGRALSPKLSGGGPLNDASHATIASSRAIVPARLELVMPMATKRNVAATRC